MKNIIVKYIATCFGCFIGAIIYQYIAHFDKPNWYDIFAVAFIDSVLVTIIFFFIWLLTLPKG